MQCSMKCGSGAVNIPMPVTAGYGSMFRNWIIAKNPKPYNSFGNGSAMRVSAAGWLFDTLDKTLEMAKVTAEVTHNHPEGIKGAQATAALPKLFTGCRRNCGTRL